MKTRLLLFCLLCCAACNSRPPDGAAGLAGLYYPIRRSGAVDSSEVLHVTRIDNQSCSVLVAGNTGVGTFRDGRLSGEISGPAIGKTPFTFTETRAGLFEFRAFGNRVELKRLLAPY
ncbi:MAG: hypothetical protein EOO11_16065 [Chitinophagaceae bacterium]|nr:MAG: hypothetical protein EOO11_16065 [Chitinophagaceae bacterium]